MSLRRNFSESVIASVSRARQALHWISAEKRKRGRPSIRHNNEGYQPDECDVGRNLPNSKEKTGAEEWKIWTAQCASHWKD